MTTPSTEEFEAAMARVEAALPAPDEQGRRRVTAGQIEKVKAIIDEFFQSLFDSFIKKAAVELDGEEHFLDEEELDALGVGTLVRFEDSLFVRCPHDWLELITGWRHKNGHVFWLLADDNTDCRKIVVTTPR